MDELVPTLRRFGELEIADEVAVSLPAMSPATIDRRLAADRAKLVLKGSFAYPRWVAAEGLDPDPHPGGIERRGSGFVEIDLVGHEGAHPVRLRRRSDALTYRSSQQDPKDILIRLPSE